MTDSTLLETSPKPIVKKESFQQKLDDLLKEDSNKSSISCLPINLFQDYVEVEVHAGVKKHISYVSFKELINKSLNQVEEAPVVTGILLPSNVTFFSVSSKQMHLNVYHPGAVREMLYLDKKMQVVVPNVIIGFTLNKESGDWVVSRAAYFCTDLPVSKLPKTFIDSPDHKHGIYDLPMSNTYGGGAMCYGGNSMPARFKEGNLRGLDWYFRFLWETPFNNDLGIRAIGDAVGVSTWYKTLEKLAKEGKGFPYKDLRGYRTIEGSPTTFSALRDLREDD